MEAKAIKELLQKYDQGATSLEEEALLRNYFAKAKDIPDSWKVYSVLFDYFKEASTVTYAKAKPNRFSLRPWMAVAAMIAIVATLFLTTFSPSNEIAPDQEELYLAFEQFQNNIKQVSIHLNKGTEQLAYLDYWNETTKKLIK